MSLLHNDIVEQYPFKKILFTPIFFLNRTVLGVFFDL
jgi:hypothetical protein